MKALPVLFGLLMAVATVWSFHIPPALDFREPNLARIFVWHFPCPIIASVLLLFNGWFCFRYLVPFGLRAGTGVGRPRTADRAWDERGYATLELAFLWSLLTMATGMLFSKVQWGAWWQWDPRQTSFLLVLFIYAANFALRGAISDPDRRAVASSAYLLAALLPALFLIFVYPRMVDSMHPSDSILKGKIKGEYAWSVMTMMTLMSILSVWLYRLRARVGLLELAHENYDE